jgi:hypothetical protein
MNACVYVCGCTYVCMDVCMCVCVCMYVCMYVCAHVTKFGNNLGCSCIVAPKADSQDSRILDSGTWTSSVRSSVKADKCGTALPACVRTSVKTPLFFAHYPKTPDEKPQKIKQ